MPSNPSRLIANIDLGLSFSPTLSTPVAGALLFILFYFTWNLRKKYPPLPPGPRRFPFFGNFFDLPKEYNWENWAKYKELYGPISCLRIFGQHIIIINEVETAIDLLDKRSAIHSNRPHLTFAEDLAGWKGVLALAKYGDTMRTMRKHFHQLIGTPKLASRFHPLEELEATRLVKNLLEGPRTFQQHVRSFVGATVIKATYGYSVDYESDPLVNLANKGVFEFSVAVEGGAWVVDSLPILRWVPGWFPGAGFQNTAKQFKETVGDFLTVPVDFVRDQMAAGRASPSLVSSLIESEQTDEDRHLTAMTAISMLGGGADTTVSSLCTFFLAMTLYPGVQAKAQQELNRVVGWDRLPTFEDRDRLPYINAIMKEVLRWGVVAPLGLPHAALQDDIFMGYRFPKGAIIMPNIWYFLHNPEVYPNPEKFIPERHLAEDGKEVATDPRLYCFGFGRRVCPGKEMAESSIFIVIALVLATLNITKARNASGEEITPPYRMTDTLISHPVSFVCDISPRSEKVAALVHSANEEQPFKGGDAKHLSEHIRVKYKSV